MLLEQALSYAMTTSNEVNGLLGLAYPLTYETAFNGGGTAGPCIWDHACILTRLPLLRHASIRTCLPLS